MSEVISSGAVRIVVEGARRAIWDSIGDRKWHFGGLWPTEEQERALKSHLLEGGQLLVVVGDLFATVQALSTELRAGNGDERDEEVVDIAVPFLDWLPAGYRRSGIRQVNRTRRRFDRMPALLRPPLVLVSSRPNDRVIFAVRTSTASGEIRNTALTELAEFAFSSRSSAGGRVAVPVSNRLMRLASSSRLLRAEGSGQ